MSILRQKFLDLSEADEARILALIVERKHDLAMDALRAATGCPPIAAKGAILRAASPNGRFAGPPCPHCAKPLASSEARQCLWCHADWHEKASAERRP